MNGTKIWNDERRALPSSSDMDLPEKLGDLQLSGFSSLLHSALLSYQDVVKVM